MLFAVEVTNRLIGKFRKNKIQILKFLNKGWLLSHLVDVFFYEKQI